MLTRRSLAMSLVSVLGLAGVVGAQQKTPGKVAAVASGPALVTPEDIRAWIGRRVLLTVLVDEPSGTPPRKVSMFGEVVKVDGPGEQWRYQISIGAHTIELAAGQFCTIQYA